MLRLSAIKKAIWISNVMQQQPDPRLAVFTNDVDTVVAYDEADAFKVLTEALGMEDQGMNTFTRVPDMEEIGVSFEIDYAVERVNLVGLEGQLKDGLVVYRTTAWEWSRRVARGMLCSQEP